MGVESCRESVEGGVGVGAGGKGREGVRWGAYLIYVVKLAKNECICLNFKKMSSTVYRCNSLFKGPSFLDYGSVLNKRLQLLPLWLHG